MNDKTFVISIAERYGLGWLVLENQSLQTLSNLVFEVIQTRQIQNADHLRKLLQQSPAGMFMQAGSLSTEEEQRLYNILIQHQLKKVITHTHTHKNFFLIISPKVPTPRLRLLTPPEESQTHLQSLLHPLLP